MNFRRVRLLAVFLSLPAGACSCLEAPPSAQLVLPERVAVGQPFMADGRGSAAGHAPIERYRWDFGDGTPQLVTSGAVLLHRYAILGSYQVDLQVIDQDGLIGSAQAIITVEAGFPEDGPDAGAFTEDASVGDAAEGDGSRRRRDGGDRFDGSPRRDGSFRPDGGRRRDGGLVLDAGPGVDGAVDGGRRPGSCTDLLTNGMETDVDCGGGNCADCAGGLSCIQDVDCASGNCRGGRCVFDAMQLSFATATTRTLNFAPLSLAVADFTADGFMDLAVAGNGANHTQVMMGAGDGTLGPAIVIQGPVQHVTAGDLDGDGLADLALTDGFNRDVRIMRSNGQGGFPLLASHVLPRPPSASVVLDLDGDEHCDLVTIQNTASTFTEVFNPGVFSARQPDTFNVQTGPATVLSEDFNGDGLADLAITLNGDFSVAVYLAQGGALFGPAQTAAVVNQPYAMAPGDLNNDGNVDLVVPEISSESLVVLLGHGDGTFLGSTVTLGFTPFGVATADFNGDGNTDVALTDIQGTEVQVLPGTGLGTFGPAVALMSCANPNYISTADFNHDGRMDMAVGCVQNVVMVLLNTSI